MILNLALVGFGFWCFFWPVRRDSPSAIVVAYTPGVATAPILLILPCYLARQLVARAGPLSAAA